MVQLPKANVDLAKLRCDDNSEQGGQGSASGWLSWLPWSKSPAAAARVEAEGGNSVAKAGEEVAQSKPRWEKPKKEYWKYDPYVGAAQSSSNIREEAGFRQFIPVNRFKSRKKVGWAGPRQTAWQGLGERKYR